MKNFIYNTPTKVFFGKGQENNLGKILNEKYKDEELYLINHQFLKVDYTTKLLIN